MSNKSIIHKSIGAAASLALLGGFVGCAQAELSEIEAYARDGVFSDGSVQGRFDARVADMLDGTARYSFHLVDGEHETEIIIPEGMQGEIQRDMVIRATGVRDHNGVLVVSDYVVLQSPLIDPELLPFRRLATILVFWGDTPGLSNPSAYESMFAGNKSTNVFYGENSYGRETMAGEVFGPYQIEDPGGCNTSLISQRAIAAMREKGHDETDFRQLMYQFPSAGCGFGGLASIGSPSAPARDSWYNGSFGCVVRNQEIGHNYGMGHSRDYSGCPADDPISQSECEPNEYGDVHDPMGSGCEHMNVVQKEYMNWLEGCNVVRTTSSGQFNLLPVERPCNGTQSLRFPAYDGRDYFLEYRTPVGGFDSYQGVLLHVAGETAGRPASYLVGVGNNGVLVEGDSYTDPQNGVTFSIISTDIDHAVIDIQFPGGGSGSPTCSDGTAPLVEAGAVGSLECDASPFLGDDESPVVEITYPLDGDYFLPGSNFTITADAMDDRDVVEAELYFDGEPLNKLLESPWEWDVTSIPEGTYEFGIVARDAVNFGLSNVVTIIVTNDIPEPEPETGTDGIDSGTAGDTEGVVASDTDDSTAGSTDSASDRGCGCNTKGGGPLGALGLAMLGLALARRRRSA